MTSHEINSTFFVYEYFQMHIFLHMISKDFQFEDGFKINPLNAQNIPHGGKLYYSSLWK